MLIITQFKIRRSGAGMRISGVLHEHAGAIRNGKISGVTEITSNNTNPGYLRAMQGDNQVALLAIK